MPYQRRRRQERERETKMKHALKPYLSRAKQWNSFYAWLEKAMSNSTNKEFVEGNKKRKAQTRIVTFENGFVSSRIHLIGRVALSCRTIAIILLLLASTGSMQGTNLNK